MTFAAPTMLAGLAAVAIPVLVHFLLRPRARRIRFPAVAHVRAALAAGRRAQRLRNLVVMLLRCALVALAVFLLAGPRWSAEKGAADDGAQSTDAVIIVDDSWSTRYSPSVGRPWRDEILAAAIRELRRLEERPETRAGLLFSGQPAEAVELTTKFSSLRARLEGYESSTNARSLRTALDIAGTALARSNAMRREVVIVTDGAAHAWRDADGGSLRDLTKLHVRVVAVENKQPISNLAVTHVEAPVGVYPETAPLRIRAAVRADGVDARFHVSVAEPETTLARVGPFELEAGGGTDVSLVVSPRPAGTHALKVAVEPADRIAPDQVRYAVVETGPRPRVWLVRDAETADDLSTTLMRNLLAPELLEPERQLVALIPRQGIPTPDPAAAVQERPRLILLMANTRMDAESRAALREWVERGVTLILVPTSSTAEVDWPGVRHWFSDRRPRVVEIEAGSTWRWSADHTSTDSTGDDEMTKALVRRRVEFSSLTREAHIEAKYEDGAPALISLRRGKGRAMLLTTSPDPAWSELGIRAAGLLAWLYARLGESAPHARRVASFEAHAEARWSFGGLAGPRRVLVRRVAPDAQRLGPVALDATSGPLWPTERAGVYEVLVRPDAEPQATYVVNWPAEESDYARVSADRIAALFGAAEVEMTSTRVVNDDADSPSRAAGWRWLRARDAFAAALVALAFLEQIVAVGARRRDSGDGVSAAA